MFLCIKENKNIFLNAVLVLNILKTNEHYWLAIIMPPGQTHIMRLWKKEK